MFRCTPLCKNQGGCLAVRTFCCLLILSWVAGVVGSSVATAQDTCSMPQSRAWSPRMLTR